MRREPRTGHWGEGCLSCLLKMKDQQGAVRNIRKIRYLKARGPFPKEKDEWYLLGVNCISPINNTCPSKF